MFIQLIFNFTAPTAPPTNLRVISIESHSLSLSWEPPSAENRNGFIRLYHIRLKEVETEDEIYVLSNITQVTVNNLHPFYTYNCSVAPETVSLGPFSEHLTVQLEESSKFSL